MKDHETICWNMDKAAGIYIHIPFCVRKCSYCDFLSAPADAAVRQRYVIRLKEELRLVCHRMLEKGEKLSTIYFGGGTPSLLSGEQIGELMAVMKAAGLLDPSQEITLEMNPGTVTAEKLQQYKAAGINRLSIGVQSFRDEELRLLGRIHTSQDFLDALQMARAAGFTNISIDLMSGLPGQTAEQWRDSLRQAVSLEPEHISAYSLIIEEGTPFYERYGADWSEEHEELDREMYEDTNRILEEAGYHRYEISNYARPGRESRHNSSYWTGIPYYGCGLGASSLIREGDAWYRTVNLDRMEAYLQAPTGESICFRSGGNMPDQDDRQTAAGETALYSGRIEDSGAQNSKRIQLGPGQSDNSGFYQEIEKLTVKDRIEEFMFLGLRMTKGVSKAEFYQRFGILMDDLYSEVLKNLIDSGLLWQIADGDRLRLSEKGLDLSNYCFAQFLLDELP